MFPDGDVWLSTPPSSSIIHIHYTALCCLWKGLRTAALPGIAEARVRLQRTTLSMDQTLRNLVFKHQPPPKWRKICYTRSLEHTIFRFPRLDKAVVLYSVVGNLSEGSPHALPISKL